MRGTCLGVPIIRTIVFWGLYWGPFILGNYHVTCSKEYHLVRDYAIVPDSTPLNPASISCSIFFPSDSHLLG